MADNTPPPQQLKPDSLPLFFEGISLLLSKWTALQMAVMNEWGGKNSRAKSEQLASDIFTWFSRTEPPLYIDDLEQMLAESMVESFNTMIEDGSEEEVAEKLMIMHEEFLTGNYELLEKLKKSTNSGVEAAHQSKKMVVGDDDESSDDEKSDMLVDEQKPKLNLEPTTVPVAEHKERKTVQDEDGWSVVPSRRNKGKGH